MPQENLATFGGRLKWLRAEKGRGLGQSLTLEAAALELQQTYNLQLSRGRLHQLERMGTPGGKETGAVQLEQLAALAHYYNVTIDFLVKGPLRGIGDGSPPLGPTVVDEDGYDLIKTYSQLSKTDRKLLLDLAKRLGKPTFPQPDQ